MLDSLSAWLGVKKAALVAGFFGSLVSLIFINGPWWYRCMLFGGGLASSVFLTPGFVEHFEIAKAENAMAFMFGLLGMSVVAAATKTINGIDFASLNTELRKWLGRKG